MGDKISLDLSPRTVSGKKVASLRKEGQVPGVVYGHGIDEPVNVQAPAIIVNKVVKQAGRHHPVYLKVDGKSRIAMIKNIDFDPVKQRVRHISLHAVKQNEKVEADVPIRLVGEGESVAEKAGLVVLQTLESIKVHALPSNLPDALELSIIDLTEPHEQITVSAIKLPEGVELDDAEEMQDIVVASVYEPSALQAANDALAGTEVEEAEAVEGVESEHGEDTDQASQEPESRPGGHGQKEPKPSQLEGEKKKEE
jgi:large subunit ribosomal protein L25